MSLELVLTFALWGYIATSGMYILLGGKKGFFWVKQRLPWLKNKGAFYIKGFTSDYIEIDYGEYKGEIPWDKEGNVKTYVRKPFNKEKVTGIPVIFAYEKQTENFNPFSDKEPMPGAEQISALITATEQAAFNRAKKQFHKNESYEKWILWGTVATIVLLIVVFIIGIVQMGTLNELAAAWAQYQPTVDQLIQEAQAGGNRIA